LRWPEFQQEVNDQLFEAARKVMRCCDGLLDKGR